jgi:transcriptional regulator with XRE-family HTH domain
MKTTKNFREKVLDNPIYWVEGINGMLYDAIITYMEKHHMKQKDLARHLSISPGRVSQILNEGNINFSLEKLIEIALKVDKYPNFIFEDKSSFREIKSQKIQVKSVIRKSRTEKQPNRTLIHK